VETPKSGNGNADSARQAKLKEVIEALAATPPGDGLNERIRKILEDAKSFAESDAALQLSRAQSKWRPDHFRVALMIELGPLHGAAFQCAFALLERQCWRD
jgi:hypothetical protein